MITFGLGPPPPAVIALIKLLARSWYFMYAQFHGNGLGILSYRQRLQCHVHYDKVYEWSPARQS